MKEKLIKFLNKELNFEVDFDKLLKKPKINSQGDFSFPCFILAKKLGKNPAQISKEFAEKLSLNLPIFLSKIEFVGPFLNFYLNNELESKEIIENILNGNFSKINLGKNEKILIEYPSPNTNKALHIGHVRNILLGNSLIKILEKTGFNVIKTNMNNDRGIAVCKTMLGYKLFFKNETPTSFEISGGEFASKCYVKFVFEAKKNPQLDIQAQEMLLGWEKGEIQIRKLWEKVLSFVYKGYTQTYKNYKLGNFDKIYFESEIYDKGKNLVLKALNEKIEGFGKEDDGAIYCDFKNKTLGKKYLLRGDGTTLYMTQDLYLASIKEEEFKPEKLIFIVAKEQEYHFKVLFELLERMKIIKNKNMNFHFAYGMVYDKNGKKFSSRNGDVISADELFSLVILNSKKNLFEKDISKNLSEKEIERRAKIIGFSALSFAFLKINPLDDIKFDLDKSLAMTGETGPYILYTYARIKSVLRKAKYINLKNTKIDYSVLGEKEITIIKILKTYRDILQESSEKYKISAIANFLIKLSKAYNDFYQNNHILDQSCDIKNLRLVLSYAVSIVIKDGLDLLNIEVLEEM